MDLGTWVNHHRHVGIGVSPYQPQPETVPPSRDEVRQALLDVGCTKVVGGDRVLIGAHEDGSEIKAVTTRAGWLITGGPRGLLSYGVPDAAALERFPSTLASVQDNARNLRPDGVA